MVQDDHFDATDATICPLTSDPTEIPLLRIPLPSDASTGLDRPSSLMVDTLMTTPRSPPGERIGAASDAAVLALSRALVTFLGIA